MFSFVLCRTCTRLRDGNQLLNFVSSLDCNMVKEMDFNLGKWQSSLVPTSRFFENGKKSKAFLANFTLGCKVDVETCQSQKQHYVRTPCKYMNDLTVTQGFFSGAIFVLDMEILKTHTGRDNSWEFQKDPGRSLKTRQHIQHIMSVRECQIHRDRCQLLI